MWVSKSETGYSVSTSSRRDFFGVLGSLFKETNDVIRPPYAPITATFSECRSCEGMCVYACEEKIIHRDAKGTPFLDFKTKGCSDCHRCLEVCTPHVLSDPDRFIQGRARITSMMCMSHHETICFACKDPCLEEAIVFQGMLRPVIIPEKCTACGYCVAVCPTGAITVIA